jgi:hypothetical protein
MKKNSRPLWRAPINTVSILGSALYEGARGAIFTLVGGKKKYVPKTLIKYRPVRGSPNGSKKFVVSSRGTIRTTTSRNLQKMFKSPKY